MVDRLKMILEFLAADRDALLDDEIRFELSERVSFDRVRRKGQFEILRVLETVERTLRVRPQAVEFNLLRRYLGKQIVHGLFVARARAG